MIAALHLNHLIRLSAESILNCMIEGTVIGFFAWSLLRVIGRRNSGTRFAVWFSALLAIAALPVLGIAASGSAAGPANSAVRVPSSWAPDILLVWAVIAGVSMLRVAVGLLQLRALRASCTAIDIATLDPLLRSTLQEFQNVRAVTLCHSDRLQVPTAIGFLRPVVVIPSWTLQELSAVDLHSTLVHELAHLRRWDDWTNLAQQVVKALLFFHPAVWWIENQLALEREMACDDAVLAQTGNPRGYAQCLVSLAEKSFLRRGLTMAQAVVNRMRQTSLRVSQILDANRSPATRVWKPALYSVAAFFVVCLVSLSHAPELIAFQDPGPDAPAASATSSHRISTSTADPNFQGTEAFAGPVSFGTNSARPTTRLTSKYLVQQGPMRSLAPRNAANRSRSRTTSPLLHKTEYQIQEHMNLPVAQSAELRIRKGMNIPVLQVAGFRVAEGTSSLVEQCAANNSALQPLRQPVSEEAGWRQPILTQTIFVVMKTPYDELRPSITITIWQVTVLDSRQAQVRIPAKQI